VEETTGARDGLDVGSEVGRITFVGADHNGIGGERSFAQRPQSNTPTMVSKQ